MTSLEKLHKKPGSAEELDKQASTRVRAGYARNFLLPQKAAVALTQSNRKRIEALKKQRAQRETAELLSAQELAKKLSIISLTFAVKTNEEGKMFGAITAADLHHKFVEAGCDLDRGKIHLLAPVKTLGKHKVSIKLHPEVRVDVNLDIISENSIEQPLSRVPQKTLTKHPSSEQNPLSHKDEAMLAAELLTEVASTSPDVNVLCENYGLRREELSRLTGFSLRALADWSAGKLPSQPAQRRLHEIRRLLDALAEIVKPAAIPGWMRKPNPAFDKLSPLQVIELGEIDRLWAMVHQRA